MDDQHLFDAFDMAALIERYLNGNITLPELDRLEEWINAGEHNRKVFERMTGERFRKAALHKMQQYPVAEALNKARLEWYDREKARRRKTRYRYLAAAAIALMVCSSAAYFLVVKKNGPAYLQAATHPAANDIVPGSSRARLILANGSSVILSDDKDSAFVQKAVLVTQHQGLLSYGSTSGMTRITEYNTVITPRGGEYQLVLADGTKVWLNAASSLYYPTSFSGKERKVQLTGEAYFEVAKDEQHPFIVHTGNTDVTVLGTKFNVSAYADDPGQKITLAEGAVQVNRTDGLPESTAPVLLKPGYEALVNGKEHGIQVQKANVEAALAWKNGLFVFDAESLGSLMRQLSRWYDVYVKYDAGVDTLFHFTGRVQRYEDINGILHLIELTGKVKFNVQKHEVEVEAL